MTFSQAVASGFSNYVGFSGRAARSEFWWWTVFTILVGIVASIVDTVAFPALGMGPVNALAALALFLPSLAISVRRLHDVDHTGWWLLIMFTIIGILLLLYWYVIKGTTGPNRFGPDPLTAEAMAT